MNDASKMSFMEHLEELRKRLITSVIAVLVGMIICWFFKEHILSFFLAPLYEARRNVEGLPDPKPLNFSSMLEPFIAYLKMSAIGGIFFAAPVILYQLWKFVAPGLYPRERRLALPFVLTSSVLFIGGSTMAYSVVFPIGFRFFLEFAAGREMSDLKSEVTIADRPDFEPPSILIADAGVPDGGPTSGQIEATTFIPPNPPSMPESETPPPWYDQILGRFVGEPCGEFSTKALEEGSGVGLYFSWHTVRCGDPPNLDTLTRNEDPLRLEWKSPSEVPPGFTLLEAQDLEAPKGAQSYNLRVPSNPGLKQLAPVLMIKDYLSFAIRLLLAFGLIFELPILISFLSLAGIVNYKQLIRFSRWFLVISVMVAALLTPPDVVTQILLATPLMILYLLSIVFAYLFGPKPEK